MSTTHLMYHDVYRGVDKSSGFQSPVSKTYKVREDIFEEQVKSCVGRDVVFTFDDGGESFIKIISPILEKYGFRGLFFISTKYIGTPGFLNEGQIKELDRRGHVIGSHTHSHPKDLASLTQEEITYEWTESKRILESVLNRTVTIASIPNGRGSKIVTEAAHDAGFQKLYTSVPTNAERSVAGVYMIGRYVIRDGINSNRVGRIVKFRITRTLLHLQWAILNTAQNMLGSYYYKLRMLMAR